MHIKKAVFPVAGFGTRLLPACKAYPKEMMTIVDMPLIQYAVNEAVEAGITELIFVINSNNHAIEEYFTANPELELKLIQCGKYDLVETVRNILPKGISCFYIPQETHQGLGHAVLCAKELVGNEPFAILLADDLIDGGQKSCLLQMIDVFQENLSSIIAVQKITLADTSKYGIVDVSTQSQNLVKIRRIIEKPSSLEAPSDLAVVGRYILTPRIFALLEQTRSGVGGEIQLTDAISKLLQEQSVYSFQFQGTRYDCGSKLGYVQATVAYALKHPEIGEEFKQSLQNTIAGIK